MKNSRSLFLALIVLSLFSFECLAQDTVDGIVVPVSKEKITVVTGDTASVTLGKKHGIVKGDIGSIVAGKEAGAAPIGKCVVINSDYQSSVCEVIKVGREIEAGSVIRFPKVTYANEAIFPLAVGTLSNIFQPYVPHERLRLCVYGLFDSGNATTALSEEIGNELVNIFSQKKRIEIVSKKAMKHLVFYPDLDRELLELVKADMKRANIDVLILGKYTLSQGRVDVALTKIDKRGNDSMLRHTFPSDARYNMLSSKILLTPEAASETERSSCTVSVESIPYRPRKDEKPLLIRHESGGNPVTEQHLKRVDFNLLHIVDAKVAIDDEVIPVTENHLQVQLARGSHRVVVSFKRAYFFNESLLYTSQREVRKEALLDISKNKNIALQIRLNPLFEKEPIVLNVYEPVQRERQVIKPIYRAETEKVVERFKD